MRVISLLYHDVTSNGKLDSSGFPGAGAATYKLGLDEFKRHLCAIQSVVKAAPVTFSDLLPEKEARFPFLLTFDDGGVSAYTHIADILEGYGWHAHFLVTANWIGSPSFLSIPQIQQLRKRGHVIGSHSCSHPERMSHSTFEELRREWVTSTTMLSDILSEQVRVASVPGGYYSTRVAEAASLAGIQVLFTSEPITKCRYVDGCLVLGRYTVWKGMSFDTAAGLASGQLPPRLKQWLFWNTKKIAKALGGEYYLKIRKLLLRLPVTFY